MGGDVWWVAPSFPIGELGWSIISKLCHQIPGVKFEGRPVWRVTLPSGGTIQMRSADSPDSLRGATLTFVVFDEAAIAKEESWPTLRPTLSVRKGKALFISTPKGTNWFYDLYQDATRPGWSRWQYPSEQSPYLDPVDIQEARESMSSLIFSQEYGAEFISASMGVFHYDWLSFFRTEFKGDDKVYMLGDTVVPASSCSTFHTVDLAWTTSEHADYTVISTWAVTPKRHLLLIDCNRGHYEGPDIVPQMQRAMTLHGGYFVVEKATRQMGIIQEAERMGLPLKVVRAEKDKVARALPATARMERSTVWFPNPSKTPWWPELEQELLSFPAGRHDDFVDTLSYAVLEVGTGGSAYADHEPLIV
jgi:predicted phage terminase large subunit-like protein